MSIKLQFSQITIHECNVHTTNYTEKHNYIDTLRGATEMKNVNSGVVEE